MYLVIKQETTTALREVCLGNGRPTAHTYVRPCLGDFMAGRIKGFVSTKSCKGSRSRTISSEV